jgi:hypothetical protein
MHHINYIFKIENGTECILVTYMLVFKKKISGMVSNWENISKIIKKIVIV